MIYLYKEGVLGVKRYQVRERQTKNSQNTEDDVTPSVDRAERNIYFLF